LGDNGGPHRVKEDSKGLRKGTYILAWAKTIAKLMGDGRGLLKKVELVASRLNNEKKED